MSKVLFVNGNAYGHIYPTLALVKELAASGEEIFYFSTAAGRRVGASFREAGGCKTAAKHVLEFAGGFR